VAVLLAVFWGVGGGFFVLLFCFGFFLLWLFFVVWGGVWLVVFWSSAVSVKFHCFWH